ncbi:UNVERIFIED_ORG: hypothetical protein C0V67_01150 [Anaplasma ovis]
MEGDHHSGFSIVYFGYCILGWFFGSKAINTFCTTEISVGILFKSKFFLENFLNSGIFMVY